ncbi:MAG: DUF2156 domain-containing protein [Spirochaetales bacterium]|nr:DUF2156 domain-containing protein [Spirochaetales bacterium]
MNIPVYPEFEPINFSHKEFLQPLLRTLDNGISEFTFANLFLFRNHYRYRISQHTTESGYTIPIIDGITPGTTGNNEKKFAMLPFGFPGLALIEKILSRYCYIKDFPEQAAELHRILFERKGFCVEQDRNNFDYVYNRRELATLNGRKYHKKRNLVNAFINNYNYEEKRIDPTVHKEDLFSILKSWKTEKGSNGDYNAAYEAIEKFEELGLRGCITYTDGKPSAYSMGEIIAHGNMFAIHFEKAVGNYKGIYQFINRSFAEMLTACIEVINREQDLGDEGLRKAKMSYRPSGFIKKYRISHSEFSPCPDAEIVPEVIPSE